MSSRWAINIGRYWYSATGGGEALCSFGSYNPYIVSYFSLGGGGNDSHWGGNLLGPDIMSKMLV